jgi:hypothetical protein
MPFMESVMASPFVDTRTPSADRAGRNALRLLVLKLAALPVWLAIGGFLSWLVHDFCQTAGLGQERIASFLILFLFVVSTVLISAVSWNSYRVATGKPSW